MFLKSFTICTMFSNKQIQSLSTIILWTWLAISRVLHAEEIHDVFIPPIQQKKSYLEIAHAHDWLSKNYDNWQSNYINAFIPQKEKGTTTIEISKIRRFSLEDESAYINYSYPTKYGAANFEIGLTPNADFLYKQLYGLGWNGFIGKGFGYIVAYKQRNYTDSLSDMMSFTLERYFGDYRIAYTNTQSSLDKHQLESSHRVQFQWIAENNNRFGISYSSGDEPVNLGINHISSSKVEQLNIDGVYWIKDIGFSASAWHVTQGEFYSRNGAQIGLRLAF